MTGVTVKTVSRVVNGGARVSPETFQKVTDAIETLGFRRNEFARQLRQRTATTIGLLLTDLSDPFFGTMMRTVEDIALQKGYMLLVASSAEDPVRSVKTLASFAARGVTNVIMSAPSGIDTGIIKSELATGSNIVLVDRPIPELLLDTVLTDNFDGAARGTKHLLQHGHRRIAFFGDEPAVYTAGERRRGYESALLEAGIAVDPELICMGAPLSVDVHKVLDTFLSLADPPTAIFSGNNRWSVLLLRTLTEVHRSMAFVGFDDFELAELLVPGRTVMAQDPAEIGRMAVQMLFDRIEGARTPPRIVQLRSELVSRGSGEIGTRPLD